MTTYAIKNILVTTLVSLLFMGCTSNTKIKDSLVQETSVMRYNKRFTLERYKQYYTEFVLFDKLNEYNNLCKKNCRKLNNKLNIFIYDVDFSINSSVYLYDKHDYRTIFHD